jgi:hypothetical protein
MFLLMGIKEEEGLLEEEELHLVNLMIAIVFK